MVQEEPSEAIMVTDAQGIITSVSEAFTRITGFSAREALGHTPRLLKSGVHTPHFYQDFWACLLTQQRWAGEIWNRRKSGEIYPQRGSVTAIPDATGRARHYVALFRDNSMVRQAEEKLYFLANHDALTGLPNRMRFLDQLARGIDRARRTESQIAVVFVDLDRFKIINDTLGHAMGDSYLRAIADRLLLACRKQDTLARWGGDEFVMALEDAGDHNAISNTLSRMQRNLAEPVILEGQRLVPAASMGVSIYPTDGATPGELIEAADAAMYRAKDLGRSRFAFFTEVMPRDSREKLDMATELRRALQESELCLHYQPQVSADDGRLLGVEALVRWRHPSRGVLFPMQFIPVASELGLIEEVGKWVLNEACFQMRHWQNTGVPIPRVTGNIAPRQLSESFALLVERAILGAALSPGQLELDITEAAMASGEPRRHILQRLHALDVRLSLDDYGTGASSLSSLRHFPIAGFKIDKSFIEGIPEKRQDMAVVQAVLALGASLEADVVAEGVETLEQFEFLRKSGVTGIMGHFICKPMAPAALAKFAFRLRSMLDSGKRRSRVH
jgi:diguanylate cyclase (GGDEF)-like protein/PAS domain S-box-containing protein